RNRQQGTGTRKGSPASMSLPASRTFPPAPAGFPSTGRAYTNRARMRSSGLVEGCEPFSLVLGDQRRNDLVEPRPCQDLVQAVKGQVDPVVGDPTLREIIGSDALRPVARSDHRLARAGTRAGEPLPLHLVEAGAQHLERLGLVLVLRF